MIGLPVIVCALLSTFAQQPDSTDVALFLIGDAGVPRVGFEPVLAALQREAATSPGERVVVFLGDNIYPRGLPDSTYLAERVESERRLNAQVVAAESSHAKTIFIPGNHDWDAERSDGWAAVRREGAYVRAFSHNTVLFLPANGCPGPTVFDAGTRVRLLLLDTQWWLQQEGQKPEGPPGTSGCPAATASDVVDSVRTDIATAGARFVVVLAHHPIYSGGAHAEHWNIGDYLGSGPVILLRRMVNSAQDFRSSVNTAMRQALSSAFDPLPPLLYVSGHDHGLQVLTGRQSAHEPLRYIVSGAGAYNHLDPTRRVDRTKWDARESGYVRIDFFRGGTVRLAVRVVDEKGGTKDAYTETLQ